MVYKKEAIYFPLMTAASVISLFKTGLIAYVLSPKDFGYFSLFLIVASYMQFSQFGLLNGLGRELPIMYGREGSDKPLNLIGLVMKLLLYSQLIFASICIIVILLFDINDKNIFILLISSVVLSVTSNFYLLSTLRLRSELKIIEYSLVNFVVVSFGLIFVIVLASAYGYKGAIFATVVTILFGFLFTHIFILDNPIFRKNKSFDKIKNILFIGLPLVCASGIQTVLFSLDKIFLAKFYTIEQLGVYSFSALPMTMGIIASGIFATYFTPSILHKYGSDNDILNVFHYCRNISIIILISSIIIIPFYYMAVNYGIDRFFPHYIDAKSIMLVFYIPAVFIASNNFSPVLLAAKKTITFVIYESILLILAIIIYSIISVNKMELIFFAYSLSFLFLIGFIVLFIYSRIIVRLHVQQLLNSS